MITFVTMELKERIATVMKVNQHNASSFADLLGVQRSSLSHILNGRNNPSLDFIAKLLKKFPNVDANWLITGIEPAKQRLQQNRDLKPKEVSNKVKGSAPGSDERRIDKIVVLYSDNSFDEYEPTKN